jgi:hypothetical protein
MARGTRPKAPLPEREPELGVAVLKCIADLPRIAEVNVANLLDRLITISK